MDPKFGSRPYMGCLYGPPGAQDNAGPATVGEMGALELLLGDLKKGEFAAVEKLVPLLESDDYDVRQYACQLFAHVCNHEQVRELKRALVCAESEFEIERAILRLGETLSLQAMPIILAFRNDIGDSEVDEYIYDVLETVLGNRARQVLRLDDPWVMERYRDFAAQFDPHAYLYGGKPVFVGDVTKEVIVAAQGSLVEQRPVVLGVQPQLLSNFSGIACPVRYGDLVTEERMQDVIGYVKTLASERWMIGRKYFYGHVIG